jgi:hypothetical protein
MHQESLSAYSIKVPRGEFQLSGIPDMELDRGSDWGPTPSFLNHSFADVDADDVPARTDPFRHGEHVIAKTASEIEHTLARLKSQCREHRRLALLDRW